MTGTGPPFERKAACAFQAWKLTVERMLLTNISTSLSRLLRPGPGKDIFGNVETSPYTIYPSDLISPPVPPWPANIDKPRQ